MFGKLNDKPIEWLIFYGENAAHKFIRILSAVAAVLLFLIYFLLGGFSLMLIFAVFAIAFAWLQTHSSKEYEYSYFAEELEITAVYNKSSRSKKKVLIQLKDVDYMVKKIEQADVVKLFCTGKNISETYSLVMNKDGKRTAYVIEAEPEFVKVMESKRKVR